MEAFLDYAATHQFTVAVGAFVALLIVFFLFKRLVKVALIFIVLLIAFGGYLYFKDPKSMPGSFKETVQRAKEETGKVVEKGRAVYDKGKAIGKKMTKNVDKLLEEEKGTSKEK